MKRNPSPSGTNNLADELAELRGLDLTALKQRWRVPSVCARKSSAMTAKYLIVARWLGVVTQPAAGSPLPAHQRHREVEPAEREHDNGLLPGGGVWIRARFVGS